MCEARSLYEAGKLKGTALQAIGYKELIRVFRNECSEAEAICNLKMETRRYAETADDHGFPATKRLNG